MENFEEYFMAMTPRQTMAFLKRFVREVPGRPIPGQQVSVEGFLGGVVQNTVRLGSAYLNEAVASKGEGVRKAIEGNRFFIAYYDRPDGEFDCCGVVLREKANR